jgi:hypothetical protein
MNLLHKKRHPDWDKTPWTCDKVGGGLAPSFSQALRDEGGFRVELLVAPGRLQDLHPAATGLPRDIASKHLPHVLHTSYSTTGL